MWREVAGEGEFWGASALKFMCNLDLLIRQHDRMLLSALPSLMGAPTFPGSPWEKRSFFQNFFSVLYKPWHKYLLDDERCRYQSPLYLQRILNISEDWLWGYLICRFADSSVAYNSPTKWLLFPLPGAVPEIVSDSPFPCFHVEHTVDSFKS